MRARLNQLLTRFRASEQGVAAVEFALIMPFLLALYLGSIEASALFTADKRVNTVSSTVGDLVSQWNPDDNAISESTLDTYFDAAEGIMVPYAVEGVKQVVSLVFVDSSGGTHVLWSKQSGGGTTHTVGQSFPALEESSNTHTNEGARGGCVVAAETSYSYLPVLGQVFTHAIDLSHTNYFIPRYGANAVIQLWDTSLSATACTTAS